MKDGFAARKKINMASRLVFRRDDPPDRFNSWVYGYLPGWEWAKNRGDYVSGRDFFKIHRQIDSPKPGYTGAQRFLPSKVKLQVESPKINTDSHLNKIKRDLVSALLNSELREAAVRRGFTCVKGRFADQAGENKSTTVFEVLVPDSRLNAHDEGNIALVHSALGNIVDELVKTFAPKLNRYFGEGN
jgi:hypothetical protein